MSLGAVGGTIGTIVGLGITLAAVGLVFEFAGQAIERTKPKSQRRKGPLVFDTSVPKGSVFGGKSGVFGGNQSRKRSGGRTVSRRSPNFLAPPADRTRSDNVFGPPRTPRRNGGGRKRKSNSFGGDFF